MKYGVCLCRRCDECWDFCLKCETSYMFVSCVHPVAFVNAALWMTCSLLMLVVDARGSVST